MIKIHATTATPTIYGVLFMDLIQCPVWMAQLSNTFSQVMPGRSLCLLEWDFSFPGSSEQKNNVIGVFISQLCGGSRCFRKKGKFFEGVRQSLSRKHLPCLMTVATEVDQIRKQACNEQATGRTPMTWLTSHRLIPYQKASLPSSSSSFIFQAY